MRSPERIETVRLDAIQWMGMEDNRELYCPCCDGYRVRMADLTYPGLLLDGTTTYSNRRYRSMDGSHRIQKMLHYGMTEAQFYVFDWHEVENYFDPCYV